MNSYYKVEGNESLVRDSTSGAIINTNASDYDKYQHRAKLAKEKSVQIKSQSEEIQLIKSEIAEIKSLLLSLFEDRKCQ